MTKKLFLTVVLIFSFQPFFAQTASAEAASEEIGSAKPCEQQQRKIKDLENERERMAQEIYYLEDKVRTLNATLDEIRSQLGNSEPRPISYDGMK
jgi:peptidoglycan hydrolase CwlO-like protein